jgi:hypothetical protein
LAGGAVGAPEGSPRLDRDPVGDYRDELDDGTAFGAGVPLAVRCDGEDVAFAAIGAAHELARSGKVDRLGRMAGKGQGLGHVQDDFALLAGPADGGDVGELDDLGIADVHHGPIEGGAVLDFGVDAGLDHDAGVVRRWGGVAGGCKDECGDD